MSRVAVIILTIPLLGLATRPSAAGELHGVVHENDDENGWPLAEVSVEAPGAEPARTGGDGRFTLRFPDQQLGATVTVKVWQRGYVVVNDLDLDAVTLGGPGAPPLHILLGKAEHKDAMARRLYRRGIVEAIEANHRQQLAGLHAGMPDAERRLRTRTLAFERVLLRACATTLAAKLANENIPGSVEARGKALRFFREGRIVEAMAALDRIELASQRELVKRQVAQAEKDEASKATMLQELGLRHDYADRFAQAGRAFEEALAIRRVLAARDPAAHTPDLAAALHGLGAFYMDQHRVDDAYRALHEALALRRRLVHTGYDGFSHHAWGLATTLGLLGALHRTQDRSMDARNALDEGLAIHRRIVKLSWVNNSAEMADLLVELGDLDRAEHRQEDARRSYAEALSILGSLAARSPDTAQPEVVRIRKALQSVQQAAPR